MCSLPVELLLGFLSGLFVSGNFVFFSLLTFVLGAGHDMQVCLEVAGGRGGSTVWFRGVRVSRLKFSLAIELALFVSRKVSRQDPCKPRLTCPSSAAGRNYSHCSYT
jgi:hypothetical protein